MQTCPIMERGWAQKLHTPPQVGYYLLSKIKNLIHQRPWTGVNAKFVETHRPCFWSRERRIACVGWAVRTKSTVWAFKASKTSSGVFFSSVTNLWNVSSRSDSVMALFSSPNSHVFNLIFLRLAIWTSSARFVRLSMWEKELATMIAWFGSKVSSSFPNSSSFWSISSGDAFGNWLAISKYART